jgi:hypothetical protein
MTDHESMDGAYEARAKSILQDVSFALMAFLVGGIMLTTWGLSWLIP